MIEWIRSPAKLLLAIAILAVTIKWLVIPGAVISLRSGTIDRDMAEMNARLEPIQGVVAGVDGDETEGADRLYYAYKIDFTAQPPGRATPLRATSILESVPIRSHGELPPNLPHRGDSIALWFDPQGTYLTNYPPVTEAISALWIGLVLLGFGVLGVVIAAILIRLAIRRPR